MRYIRLLRICVALVLFVCVNLMFFGLADCAASVVRVQLLPAVLSMNVLTVGVILVSTLLLGRVYCSTVCPMGLLQDIVIWLRRRLGMKRCQCAITAPRYGMTVRCVNLLAAVLLIAFGFVSLGAFFDGYSLYGRIVAQVFRPLCASINNMIAAVLVDAGHPYLFREEIFVRGVVAMAVGMGGIVGVVMLAWCQGRFFCNSFCPVGAVLSLVAKRAVFHVSVDRARCVRCGLCAVDCKAGAINRSNMRVDTSTCVMCFDCLSKCHRRAITIGKKSE